MRPFVVMLLVVPLASCGFIHRDAKAASEQCVSKQVPSGTKVSAERAKQIVNNCQEPVLAWLDGSMRHACRGACNYADVRIRQEREDRKAAIEALLIERISDEVRPKFVRM